jgi:hypothetical protein
MKNHNRKYLRRANRKKMKKETIQKRNRNKEIGQEQTPQIRT